MVESTDRNKNTQMSIYSYFRKTVECGLYRTRQFSGSMANEEHEVRSQVVPEKMQKVSSLMCEMCRPR